MPPTTSVSISRLWVIVVLAGLGTYLLRASLILLVRRGTGLPPVIERPLQFVPPAVLAALVAPAFLSGPASPVVETLLSPRLIAGSVALGVAWRTENMFLTIASGMSVFWGLRLLG